MSIGLSIVIAIVAVCGALAGIISSMGAGLQKQNADENAEVDRVVARQSLTA